MRTWSSELRIDFETHFYPKEYIQSLKERVEFPRFTDDNESKGLLLEYDPRIKIPRQRLLAKFTDAPTRLKDMEEAGIDMQVVSIPLPGADKLDAESSARICRIANNGLATLCQKYPSKFSGFALLPVQSGGDAASDELRRAVGDLGLKGGYLHSNSNGNFLDSSDNLTILRTANQLGVPVFVHPTVPSSHTGMEHHRLATTFGLQVDLSLSILRLIFSSALDSMPTLKLIVSHLGSTLPFIMNRIDDEFAFAKSPETKITAKPGDYIKRLYVDTVTMDSRPLEFAAQFYGADRIVFGSDYPFWDTRLHIEAVEKSNLDSEARSAIFSETARKLLRLDD